MEQKLYSILCNGLLGKESKNKLLPVKNKYINSGISASNWP